MNSGKKLARITGFVYLIIGFSGGFSMMYIPSKLFVSGNAILTAQNILASEQLFRFGIVSALICQVCFVLLPLFLYKLLKSVNQNFALLMVVFAFMGIPIAMLNMINQLAVLSLLNGSGYMSVFNPDQLHALTLLFLDIHNYGIMIAQIFWGLWLFPFGYLVFKSGFLPKFLGIWLMIGCFGYLTDSLTGFMFPNFKDSLSWFVMAAGTGEMIIMFWLLFRGLNAEKFEKYRIAYQ